MVCCRHKGASLVVPPARAAVFVTLCFKTGDKVYLSTRNLRVKKGLTKKLDQAKIGPFFIKSARGRNVFELELLADARIYPVFNV